MDQICEYCAYFAYDEQEEEYFCDVYLDEDDYARYLNSNEKTCPFFKNGDEYAVVRHQN